MERAGIQVGGGKPVSWGEAPSPGYAYRSEEYSVLPPVTVAYSGCDCLAVVLNSFMEIYFTYYKYAPVFMGEKAYPCCSIY